MEPAGQEHPHANHHSFHIPNVYARSTLHDSEDYSALPRTEEDAVEDGEVEPPSPPGVEGCQSWSEMSAYQRGLVRMTFGILGAAVLLPFNALITPSEYYRSLLHGTSKEKSFLSWLVALYNISCILFGAHATTTMHRTSIGRRIKLSMAVIIAILFTTTGLILFASPPKGSKDTSGVIFSTMMFFTLFLSAATAYLQLAVVTLANAYGPSCMGTMLSGQGVVGASVSLVQLIAALTASAQLDTASPDERMEEHHLAAVRFFAVNLSFMIFALASLYALQRTVLYAEMRTRMALAKRKLANALGGGHATASEEDDDLPSVSGVNRYIGLQRQRQLSRILATQRKVLLACLSIAYIFVVTLALFPALTAKIHSTGDALTTIVFVALHFFMFNVGDLLGRSLPSLLPRFILIPKMPIVFLCCLLRTAFIPLFLFCNINPSIKSASPTPLGDAAFFILMVALGLSNGLLATNIFVVGPRQTNLDESERDLAAGLLSWWLTFGLAIGSLASFILVGSS